jgi:hypothetical protein
MARHREAQQGFEVVLRHASDYGHGIEGTTAAVEDGQACAVEYVITLERDWLTRVRWFTGAARRAGAI